jgi:hypothetical protein
MVKVLQKNSFQGRKETLMTAMVTVLFQGLLKLIMPMAGIEYFGLATSIQLLSVTGAISLL